MRRSTPRADRGHELAQNAVIVFLATGLLLYAVQIFCAAFPHAMAERLFTPRSQTQTTMKR